MRAVSSILVKAVALATVFSGAIPAVAQYDRPALSSPHRLDFSAQKTTLGGSGISVFNPSSTDPLDGPHFFAYDVTDLNGNGDGNTGWTNLDVIGAVGVSSNLQALSSSTSTHSLEMGANFGTTTYIEDCSPTGLPCLRFATSSIRTVSTTTSEWIDFYVDKQSMTCATAWNLGASNNLYDLWGTKVNGSTPGILGGYDDRDPTGGNHAYAQFYTNGLTQVNPSDNTTPNGVRVLTVRLDGGADSLELFSDGISVGTTSTATRSTSATTSFAYFGLGVAGGGFTSPVGDFYEMRCWKSAKTDDEVAAISAAMRLKWRGAPLTGPSSIVWDARDMNGNGDASTGFTDGDAVGGAGKEWEGLSTSTATQSLQLVTLAGTAPTWVESCSNGQPCVRFAGGSLQTSSDAGWDDFFADTLDETCVVVHKPSPSLTSYASVWGTRTLSTTDTGILAFYDGRTIGTGDRFSTEGVWQSGVAISASTTAGYTPDGKVNVNFIKNSQYLDILSAHIEGVQQGTVSTATRTATATGGDVFKMADTTGFGDYYRGDIYYIQCWEEDRPVAELVAIAEHLQGIYAPATTSTAAPAYYVHAQNDFDVGGATDGEAIGNTRSVCATADSVDGAGVCLDSNDPADQGVWQQAGDCKVPGLACWDFGTGDFIGGTNSIVGAGSDFDFLYGGPTICHVGMAFDVQPTGLQAVMVNRTTSGAGIGTAWYVDARSDDRLYATINDGTASVYPTYVADCWTAMDLTQPTIFTMSLVSDLTNQWTFEVNGTVCATGTTGKYAATSAIEYGFPAIAAADASASEVYFAWCETSANTGSTGDLIYKAAAKKIELAEQLGVTLP